MTKWFPTIVLTISFACWAWTEIPAASRSSDNSPRNIIQNLVAQNLTGNYAGTVYLRDPTNKRYVMLGVADLEINGKEFTLCEKIKDRKKCSGKKITGQISFSTIPDKANLGVGQFQPKNETAIEIRWYRDTSRNILKIVRARGAARLFRFCSNITDKQCFSKI